MGTPQGMSTDICTFPSLCLPQNQIKAVCVCALHVYVGAQDVCAHRVETRGQPWVWPLQESLILLFESQSPPRTWGS